MWRRLPQGWVSLLLCSWHLSEREHLPDTKTHRKTPEPHMHARTATRKGFKTEPRFSAQRSELVQISTPIT